ncbi:MAG: hypothetical protein A3J74_08400 [Elusimicrobia bacterium RIFCSPHIGHO2_02_FULL_57_9]|nr:MAG: hypothetical protein A3J74_08400 [Elusimicrobia bacterium RIFCSPHIGHO2_02_FULL_57_9]
MQAVGSGKGRSWIVHSGISLPFQIGPKGFYAAKKRAKSNLPKAMAYRSLNSGSRSKKEQSDLIIIR